jgi:DNA-binding NtrC family response regulator
MKLTVLVVDDIQELCTAYRRMLEPEFDVLTALNLESAKQLAPGADAILTDWHIGNENPESLLNDFPIPTVVLTSDPSQAPQGIRTLIKPSSPGEIRSAIKAELAKAVPDDTAAIPCPNCDDPSGLQQIGPSSFWCSECQYRETR